MTFKQRKQITTTLHSPFWLSVIPKSLKEKTKRTRFVCGYRAVAALQKLKLDAERFYGADVADNTGIVVAELE